MLWIISELWANILKSRMCKFLWFTLIITNTPTKLQGNIPFKKNNHLATKIWVVNSSGIILDGKWPDFPYFIWSCIKHYIFARKCGGNYKISIKNAYNCIFWWKANFSHNSLISWKNSVTAKNYTDSFNTACLLVDLD